MEVIMKERNRQPKIPGGRVFLFIVATILFINISVIIINRLAPLAAGFASLILVLLVMVIAYRVMTGRVTEYYYILTDSGLLFHRAMGIREIKLMEIPYDRITDIRPAGDIEPPIKVYYFLCDKNDSGKRVLTFRDGDKVLGVAFAPGREFLDALLEKTAGS